MGFLKRFEIYLFRVLDIMLKVQLNICNGGTVNVFVFFYNNACLDLYAKELDFTLISLLF